MAVRVVAREKIQSGKKDAVLEIFREMAELTRKEKGCAEYALYESLDDPDVVAMIELWDSEDDLDAHMASEHFKRLIPKAGECMAEPTRVEVFRKII